MGQDSSGNPMTNESINRLAHEQVSHCRHAESPTCFDRAYIWSTEYSSPKLSYPLSFSKDVQQVVDNCKKNNFAIAIATHGGDDFTDLQNKCPVWAANNCTAADKSTCTKTKRCHAVELLGLKSFDPGLEKDCDAASDFVNHDPNLDKNKMMLTILTKMKNENMIDANSKPFKVWFYDDEGSNRKKVADGQDSYASLLALQVQTCSFSPQEWTTYQTKAEGWRGNNLAFGLVSNHTKSLEDASTAYDSVTDIGCRGGDHDELVSPVIV